MKSYPMPANFDGAKFAARYGLNALSRDFYIEAGSLFVPDSLPDSPVFEAPDSPTVRLQKLSEALADDAGPQSNLLRAVLATVFEEFNSHAAKINAILDAIDAAASLPALKTAIAAIVNYPTRTKEQAMAAVKAKIRTE